MKKHHFTLLLLFVLCSLVVSCMKKDTTPPFLRLNGSADTTVVLNSGPFQDPGSFSKDETDGEVNAIVDGRVNTDSAATYVITYTAIDKQQNRAIVQRTVHVVNFADKYSGTYSVTTTCTSSNLSYTETVLASSRYNRYIVFTNFGNYPNTRIEANVKDSVDIGYQERPGNKPSLSRIVFYGSGHSTSKGFIINYVVDEVDTSKVPKHNSFYCTATYTKQ